MAQSTTTTKTTRPGEGIAETVETRSDDARSSVEIAVDAKGTPRFTVKVYHADASEAAAEAERLMHSLAQRLKVQLSTMTENEQAVRRVATLQD